MRKRLRLYESINRKVVLILCICIANTMNICAQREEYKMDIGGMTGGCFYMGDANRSVLYKGTRPMIGVVARYIFNPHMALKGDLAVGGIKGNTADFKNKYPNGENAQFSRTLIDLGAQIEYNFWGYGLGEEYLRIKRLTPYIVGGMGFTFAPAPAENVFTVNFPLGIGVKYKAAPRWNIGCEFTMRFSLSDKLDVTSNDGLQLNDPYNISGKGFKNKDSYSYTSIFVTYDLFPKCKTCNKLY